jgi:hypothetical protein
MEAEREEHSNRLPVDTLVLRILLCIPLTYCGVSHFSSGELSLPTKSGREMHLHGVSARLMCAAILVASAVVWSTVAGHFYREGVYRHSRMFAARGKVLSVVLGLLALLLYLFLD